MDALSKQPPSGYKTLERPYVFFYFIIISSGAFLYSKY